MTAREQINALVKQAMAEKAGAFSDLPDKDPDAQRLLEDYWSGQRYARDRAMLQNNRMSGATRTTLNRQMPTGRIRFRQQPTPQQMGRYSNGKMIPRYSAQPAQVAPTPNVTQTPGGKFDFRSEAIKLLKQRGVTGNGASGKYTNGSIGSKMRDQYKDVLAGKYNEQQQRAILDEWKKNLAYARPMNAQEIARRANDPTWNTAARRAQLAKAYMPNRSGTGYYSAVAKGSNPLNQTRPKRGKLSVN